MQRTLYIYKAYFKAQKRLIKAYENVWGMYLFTYNCHMSVFNVNKVLIIHISEDLKIISNQSRDHTGDDVPVTMEVAWKPLHHRISISK